MPYFELLTDTSKENLRLNNQNKRVIFAPLLRRALRSVFRNCFQPFSRNIPKCLGRGTRNFPFSQTAPCVPIFNWKIAARYVFVAVRGNQRIVAVNYIRYCSLELQKILYDLAMKM